MTGDRLLFGHSDNSLLVIDDLVFDTGAELTIVLSGEKRNCVRKRRCGSIKTIGSEGKGRMEKVFFIKEMSIDSILVKNVIAVEVDSERLSPDERKIMKQGIIGMNVISKSNWLIDFDKKMIRRHPHPHREENLQGPAITLPYYNKNHPHTDLLVEGIRMKNILIDSGAEHCLKLPITYRDSLLNRCTVNDSIVSRYYGLYSDVRTLSAVVEYQIQQLQINGHILTDVWIQFTEKEAPSVGMDLFRRFGKVYINSKEQYIGLYKE